MSTPPRLIVLQALASMAWADNFLDPRQQSILVELFEDDGVAPELAKKWLRQPVEFPEVAELTGILSDGSDRMDLVTQLLHLAMTDRWFHPGEMALMRRLGQQFGIDESVLQEMDHFGA